MYVYIYTYIIKLHDDYVDYVIGPNSIIHILFCTFDYTMRNNAFLIDYKEEKKI